MGAIHNEHFNGAKCRTMRKIMGFFSLWLSLLLTPLHAVEFDKEMWKVRILRVYNPRLPVMPEKEFKRCLKEARQLLTLKFHAKVRFQIVKTVNVSQFFETTLRDIPSSIVVPKITEANLFLQEDMDISHKEFLTWLSFVGLEEAENYYGKKFNSADEVIDETLQRYRESKKALLEIKRDYTSPYFKNYPIEYDALSYWSFLLSHSKINADLIVTNQALIPDGSTLPALHVAVYKGVAHGFANVGAPYVERHWALVSTFPFYVKSTFYQSKAGNPLPSQKSWLMAEMLAHELGHLLFYMPDHSSPNQESCIMQRSLRTINDLKRVKSILKRPACPYEVGWVKLTQVTEGCKAHKSKGQFIKIIKHIESSLPSAEPLFLRYIAWAYMDCDSNQEAKRVLKHILTFNISDGWRNYIMQELE